MELQESWKNRLKKWQEQNKKSFAEWWDKKSNSAKVLCAAALSVIIFLLIYFTVIRCSSEDSAGYWNFIILIVSSPVAFVIWQFRDENQRKDINLKEFQKLSEWVSGTHLPEIKIINKNTTKSSFTTDNESAILPEKQITEQIEEYSKEYGQKPDNAHLGTFSKWNGAVALQISAIYNLLPFFRGDYGESFRLPAFNLLKSAWQSMQQESLNDLNEPGEFYQPEGVIIDELEQTAQSPMGIALTQVLLSLNRESTQLNLRDFPETLPNICLAGIDFDFSEIKEKAKEKARDLSQLNLDSADLRAANLCSVNLHGAELFNANLSYAKLQDADLSNADLRYAVFTWKELRKSRSLLSAKIRIKNFSRNIYPYWKQTDSQIWENLTEPEQKEAMQKFCNETRMIIFDDDGNVVAKRQS
ncbi:secreted effector protein PipB [Kingella denitrificans]|uniref:Pentapeptide repeat protein n=1 Tax=Kingella denitrificans ATCC 33394 TaxID=888741 RepID=F0EXV4_9NEIS|nr:pentapeptide repeat-containing protein [Kingella denitrificans]EGC17853.1 pentapeptide repeat protein [Kingella denitrificans ATCC 33394]QQB41377.1 pentapeptide repeat-containing protein [Kingella denitrificans]STR12796.1 secreted effector protein PipB [Kingella denitrificans]